MENPTNNAFQWNLIFKGGFGWPKWNEITCLGRLHCQQPPFENFLLQRGKPCPHWSRLASQHCDSLSQLLCNPSATPTVFYLVKGKQDLWPLTSFPFSRLSCLPSEFISLSLCNIKGKEQEQRGLCGCSPMFFRLRITFRLSVRII